MPQALPATPGYVPRTSSNVLKEIVEDHYEELLLHHDEKFRDTYGPMHPRVKDLFEAFVRCGDPHFGFLRLRCCNPNCEKKAERIVPYSCKSRGLCPSCGQKRAILWAERMVEEVLPDVPYAAPVFTIPKMLRKAFLFDHSLYGDLCDIEKLHPTLIDAVIRRSVEWNRLSLATDTSCRRVRSGTDRVQ